MHKKGRCAYKSAPALPKFFQKDIFVPQWETAAAEETPMPDPNPVPTVVAPRTNGRPKRIRKRAP